MRPKFLLDEQISPRVAEESRKRGLDVVAIAGSSRAGMDDPSVLRAATREHRILVTYDVADFSALYGDFLKEGVAVPGLVFVDRRTIPTSDPQGLAKALAALARKIVRGDADPAGGLFLTR